MARVWTGEAPLMQPQCSCGPGCQVLLCIWMQLIAVGYDVGIHVLLPAVRAVLA